jgi:hypothetical protein
MTAPEKAPVMSAVLWGVGGCGQDKSPKVVLPVEGFKTRYLGAMSRDLIVLIKVDETP